MHRTSAQTESPTRAERQGGEPASVPASGRCRVVIENVSPCVDGGRFPIKRVEGEPVVVEADIFADGHDVLAAVLRWRADPGCEETSGEATGGEDSWRETRMRLRDNDRWEGSFEPSEQGRYVYTIEAWVDRFASWRRDLEKRRAGEAELDLELRAGAELVSGAAASASGLEADSLESWAKALAGNGRATLDERMELALGAGMLATMSKHAPRHHATRLDRELPVVVDRERARFSAWYELFPRSAAGEPGRHGTFRDVERLLPYVAELGFDVLYLPPIHPIGTAFRKGRNNTTTPETEDVGSPWAIGAAEGGHEAVHPELGTLEDFRRLVASAREQGLELALDVAFQTSPDHPWVREHPQWFRQRPDGSIRYAENPPKKYQDIYPIDFESEDWAALWKALRGVFEFWIEEGVLIFRVDNPHTKSLRFWDWCISTLKQRHPGALFLSEAFTRPKLMYRLAKGGFTQSYTYFPWRNTKQELSEYMTTLATGPQREFFRPNHWPNTPDILTEYLQSGGRPAFAVRLVLAATLGASYGIYGPAFELCENRPVREGSEEYLDSEKYQLRSWDLDAPHSLRHLVARINRIRRDNPALQSDWSLRFHETDNEELLAYSKREGDNIVLVVVNLDPHHVHSGWIQLDGRALGVDVTTPFQVHDLISDARYIWQGDASFVQLDPAAVPAHVFRVRRRLRTERDFDYYF